MKALFINQKPDYFVSPAFMFKLVGESTLEYNYNSVSKWGNRREPYKSLFTRYRKVFFPVNINRTHWTLIEVDFDAKSMSYFDSDTNYCNMWNVIRETGLDFKTFETVGSCSGTPTDAERLATCNKY